MRYILMFMVAGLVSSLAFVAGPAGLTSADNVDTALYGSGDRFVIASLGIDAPVNVRNVAADGVMHDPAGKDDVVRYEFPLWPGLMGGSPGKGGTVVVSGHVDYRPNFQAVFWTLRQATAGTQIDYYRADGAVVSYVVDWVTNVGGQDDIGQHVVSSTPETMILISCEGSFDPVTRHYNNRTVVHATRIS